MKLFNWHFGKPLCGSKCASFIVMFLHLVMVVHAVLPEAEPLIILLPPVVLEEVDTDN